MMDYLINPTAWDNLSTIRWWGQLSWLFPLITALLLNRFKCKTHQRILVFVLFTIVMEHVSSHPLLVHFFHDATNSPWYHLGVPILFFLVSTFYWEVLFRNQYRSLRWLLPLGFLVITAINTLGTGSFYRFPSIPVGIYSFAGISFAIAYFLHRLQSKELREPTQNPLFWVSTGFLVYYVGNILVWGTMNFLNQDHYIFTSIYRVIGVTTIFLNTCFTIALYCSPNKDEVKKNLNSA
jgi:hypothetical protein